MSDCPEMSSQSDVSILVLVDLAFEFSKALFSFRGSSGVSILVLVDLAFE